MIGVTVVAGPWLDGVPAVARRIAAASPDAVIVRSPLAPVPPPPPDAAVAHPTAGRPRVIEAEPEIAYRTVDCPCCATRLDLVDVVGTLARRRRPPRHVVIEALPPDDPAIIVQTLLGEPDLDASTTLDAVVAVVHGPTVAAAVVTDSPPWDGAAADAVRMADRITVGRTGELTWRGTHMAGWTARGANRAATVDIGEHQLDPSAILDARAWTPERLPGRLHDPTTSPPGTHDRDVGPAHYSAADRGAVTISVAGSLDEVAADEWLDRLHATYAGRILRFEAILSLAGRPSRWLATGLRTTLQAHDGAPWHDDERRASHLRLVGDDLDHRALARTLVACTVP